MIWYIFNDPRLSITARNVIEEAATSGDQIGFSSITLAEVVYLTERGRIPADTFDRLLNALETEEAVLVELPFDRYVAEALREIDRDQVPDLPDRIIVATAMHRAVPLISRDRRIRLAQVEVLW